MLSILIPTYNQDVTLLVKNLSEQCRKASFSFEIIVLDDGSSEKEKVLINRSIHNLDHCSYIENKNNQGRTASRQFLAEKAAFEKLLFLDADVMPKYPDFIKRFVDIDPTFDIIFGGIEYEEEKPPVNKILRWKYGRSRESLSVSERKKAPYLSVNSGCFLIKKNLFLSVNGKLNFNKYGLDNLFKQLLRDHEAKTLHIDNPIFHLGLEDTTTFLKKSLESIETTVLLEEKGLIEEDLRPIQISYLRLKKMGLTRPFSAVLSVLKKPLESNFKSSNPNLFWFDLYRLHYYIQLKNKTNA